ncbi:aminoacyl-tRNA deacylase [Leeia aquatica]|uniref:Cys-tRNA(Pro)/Cys-tRNA(Cys) deacylase n=1 Tax=Leeia aquatica TaxID=2725557 RepID=A0A847S828_9NEIS|nr:aminoacyl-tRNA deacylase [Leeia aquatica]NLR73786.1 aminoacyl-tRNA deacylase [Leeia aquatica]
MSQDKYPVTTAVRALRAAGVAFEPCLYEYVEKGGTRHSSEALGAPHHAVIKTIVMENEARQPLIVLMHGDREISAQALARTLGYKRITPCDPDVANKHTGYLVGGTSPFGTRKPLPVYVESSILALDRIWINGGKRGFLVAMAAADLNKVLPCQTVQVAVAPS